MKTLLSALTLALVLVFPSAAAVIWSQPRDFYVDPPEGWTFVEDPTPEHFVMTDPGRRIILEIFSQDQGDQRDLKAKAADLKNRLAAQGEEEEFTWNDQQAWLSNLSFKAGPVQAKGWALVAPTKGGWISALAYTPEKDYEKASDVLISTLNSLALGTDGRREPGPMTAYFQGTAPTPRLERSEVAGLPSPLTLTYNLDRDEGIQAVIERETRVLMAQVGTTFSDQRAIAPGWSRLYRQVYRALYSSLTPVSAYWQSQVAQGKVAREALPQAVLTWLQSFTYFEKKGIYGMTTPWQSLRDHKGDCDSLALVYLAVMDQVGVPGILMVSAPYAHAIAALDLPGEGARFPLGDQKWLVAELTAKVKLGMIAQDMADPNQWIGIDLLGRP